jgi:hypothetical protein
MAESVEVKEAREAWENADARLDASDSDANRDAERAAWHAYLSASDPFGED